DDPPGKEGLFALDSLMLREGTTDMNVEQQANAIGQLGNNVSPFGFTTISQSFEPSLRLMADMITRPAFPRAELDRLKAAFGAAVARRWQDPAVVGKHVLYAKMFGVESPIARAVEPTET